MERHCSPPRGQSPQGLWTACAAPILGLGALLLVLACNEGPSATTFAPEANPDTQFQEAGEASSKNEVPSSGYVQMKSPSDLSEIERLKQQIKDIELNQPEIKRKLSEIDAMALEKDQEMQRLAEKMASMRTEITRIRSQISTVNAKVCR